jgi:hypothetical protein
MARNRNFSMEHPVAVSRLYLRSAKEPIRALESKEVGFLGATIGVAGV